MSLAIEVTSLVKNYGPTPALRGIDLAIEPGEVYGFIGPNGSGKTTTMRILLDILRPTSGAVRVLGEDPRAGGAALRSRIGYLPGELRLDGRYDVATLLDHYERLTAGRGGRPPRGAWRPWAHRVGLDVTRRVHGLSKGNKQKVGLVAAFAHRPELLVLDEPTSGLDPLVQQEFLDMVREARAAGQTVFLSSHVLSEIEHVADRVAVLREGRLALVSTVAALRDALGDRIRLRLAETVEADAFTGLPGVRKVDVSPAPGADGRPGGTRVSLELDSTPDAAIKAAARFTVLDVQAERPDLEESVMSLYRATGDDKATAGDARDPLDGNRADPAGTPRPGESVPAGSTATRTEASR